MSKIKGISHVVLYVNDLDKMVAFYRDVLGLVEYRENPGRMVFLTPDPDIDVDNRPQDYVRGVDVQLNTAIELCLEQFEKRPPHTPLRTEHRRLAPPPLTPRRRR